ncbi:hypothetical protein P2318_16910 [Myxococcaceae bacterium GXIMD 01537]
MNQKKLFPKWGRLAAAVVVLVGGLSVQAARIGAGTVAVYHREGTQPPVVGLEQKFTGHATCKCGTFETQEATAYSSISQEDADKWAEAACFQLCLKTNPPKGSIPPPSGTWSPVLVGSGDGKAQPGTVFAHSPEHFVAYLPDSEVPVAESSDALGLALDLIRVTGTPVVYLAGPLEFFAQAKPVCE